ENFAYIASHDLQEPLRMVASYLQLLEHRYKDKLDEDGNDFINFAVDGAKRMQNLINDLLSYSRVGTRGKKFEITNSDEILNQALSDLKLLIDDSGAKITYDPLPKINADNVQVGQLFQNLIGNAIKFHNEEPPKVHITAENLENDWLFSIADNGIGIDPKYSDRAFMIFQRLHNKNDYPGTGIGLAICKRIVERHKGKIWLKSKPGEGTTFYFTIPKTGSDE
ncbi:MAG: ATP-binding protein, partial [Candidatus Thorarchaeota archaeon]